MNPGQPKPYAAACDRNKHAIVEALRPLLPKSPCRLLEIGSGTGQHAVFMAASLTDVVWQTSDLRQNHAGIRMWLEEAALTNLLPPLELDTRDFPPLPSFDMVFSANTAHIMPWPAVEGMFEGVGRVLRRGGVFALYGPFTFQGHYNNDTFHAALRRQDSRMGVRSTPALRGLAGRAGLDFHADIEMPANNRMLVWRRRRRSGRKPAVQEHTS